MQQIKLSQILSLDPEEYKMHCAVYNQVKQPLEVFASNKEEWYDWNRYKGQKNDFNRPYIFSLIHFYPESDTWLFGGVFKVLSITDNEYDIEPAELGQEFIGRLKVSFKLSGRNVRPRLESHYDSLVVTEILREPYTGISFCGHENINIDFEQLETVYRNQKPDWRAALQFRKGIYLIADRSNGKKYVGSAYSGDGIWSRWQSYAETGHGYQSVSLRRLIEKEGIEYARKNFIFTLLEHMPMKMDDNLVIDRETYWKNALLSGGDFGYNKN